MGFRGRRGGWRRRSLVCLVVLAVINYFDRRRLWWLHVGLEWPQRSHGKNTGHRQRVGNR